MENFTFYAPTYFDFGKGAEQHVGELVRRFGGNKVLFHYGGGSIKRSGLYDTVKKCLEALAEVEKAEVSHESGTAVVTLSGTVSDDILRKTVEDKDYKVLSIE